MFTPQYRRLEGRNLSPYSPFQRLENHFSAHVPFHIYAVARTYVFRNALSKALSFKLDIFAIHEFIEEFIVWPKGKTYILLEFYLLLAHETPQSEILVIFC